MAAPIQLANIQGDILVGLPKQTQLFYFFEIIDTDSFRSQLANLIPLITTAEQAQNHRSEIRKFKVQAYQQAIKGDGETAHPAPLVVGGVNLAFSARGIDKIDIADGNLQDPLFEAGMRAEALDLGDKGTGSGPDFKPDWDETFLQDIHGVVLVTGDCHRTVKHQLEHVKSILGCAVKEIDTLVGDVRPGDQRGHEHFGYKDGISQPAIKNIDPEPTEGQGSIEQGIILLGRDGDTVERPGWAIDGSFLAFRKLPQLVPEFNEFVKKSAPIVLDPSADVAGLLGARLVGRWKSGAPITEAPIVDKPELGDLDVFTFTPGEQVTCPFAAHIRKMNPRGDIDEEQGIKPHRIPRRGIPFGREVTEDERKTGSTQHERGLYFVCYQSNLGKGFSFLQRAWANATNFPPNAPVGELPGEDAIIGQKHDPNNTENTTRTMTGIDMNDTDENLDLTKQWVNSKGGEYFFSPSLWALKNTFATVSASTFI